LHVVSAARQSRVGHSFQGAPLVSGEEPVLPGKDVPAMRTVVRTDEERAQQGRSPSRLLRFVVFNRSPTSTAPDGPSDPNQPKTEMYDHRTLLQRLLRGGGFWR